MDTGKVLKSPLQYAGGKRTAFKIFMEYFPEDTKEVVSPFFGGGAIELNLGVRGIRVHGFDAFEPLVNFWQYFLRSPEDFMENVEWCITHCNRDYFVGVHKGGFKNLQHPMYRAVMYYLINRMSYGGFTFRSRGLRNNYLRCMNPNNLKESLEIGKQIQNVSVEHADCFDVLEQYPDTFAFLDPPYADVKEGVYGDSEEYHENFDHQRLANVLNSRDKWIQTYNGKDFVNEYYPDRHKIPYTSKGDRRVINKEEFLILSDDVWEHYQRKPQQLSMSLVA